MNMRNLFLTLAFGLCSGIFAQNTTVFESPIMGWSSWNTYRVHINDTLIIRQADAMVQKGLKEVGYSYVNVDDGFFGWRDERGVMQTHPERFPNGLKGVADHIHSLGLKAGIYSDAGSNTCGSIWDKDMNGIGSGLYGHEFQDATLYFKEWGFDFIKIDYCGAGQELNLEEEKRYTEIRQAIDNLGCGHVSINICRWAFPGTWARNIARSWRISADIRPEWGSVKYISNIARTSFPHKKIKVICPDSASNQKGHSRQLIQRAIDSCSLAGGGHVIISKGIYYLKGNLVLKSDVNLHLEKDAYLLFSGKADDFLPEVWTRWEGTELYGHSPMIYAKHATNIAITGQGTIDAQGGREFASWSQIEVSDRNRLRKMGEKLIPVTERIFGKGTILRPSCIQFMGCSRILVEGITIKNSPFWTIHPVYCDNVIVRSITIDSHYPNNDGCDPESTSNVLIEECIFRTGDDAIAIKAGRDADGREIGRPSKNIVIRNCLFQSECNGLCIGSEMSGGVENIYMDNIQIGTVKNALYFKSNRDRGGYIRNIQVSNITIERSKGAVLRFETNYFGFRGGRHTSQYENFRINNVKAGCSDHYAIFIDGYEEKPIKNIEIEHFHVQKAPHPYYLRCVENICLKATFVNGQNLPEYPKKQKERVILDVY